MQGAVNGVVNEVNRVAETVNRKFNTNARTNYQSPQGQNPDGTYHYSYTQTAYSELQAPGIQIRIRLESAADRIIRRGTAPRNTVSQNGAPCSSRKSAAQAGHDRKYKPSNGRYWLTGIVCMLYALNGPLYRWQDLITFVVVGAAAFFIGGKIFKGQKVLCAGRNPCSRRKA